LRNGIAGRFVKQVGHAALRLISRRRRRRFRDRSNEEKSKGAATSKAGSDLRCASGLCRTGRKGRYTRPASAERWRAAPNDLAETYREGPERKPKLRFILRSSKMNGFCF